MNVGWDGDAEFVYSAAQPSCVHKNVQLDIFHAVHFRGAVESGTICEHAANVCSVYMSICLNSNTRQTIQHSGRISSHEWNYIVSRQNRSHAFGLECVCVLLRNTMASEALNYMHATTFYAFKFHASKAHERVNRHMRDSWTWKHVRCNWHAVCVWWREMLNMLNVSPGKEYMCRILARFSVEQETPTFTWAA